MKHINGDLLESGLTHIAHGANTMGVMGSGIALSIKKKWPHVFEAYKEYVDAVNKIGFGGKHLLGIAQCTQAYPDHYVWNMFTQEKAGKGKQARYTAILKAIDDFYMIMHGHHAEDDEENHEDEKLILGIPLIGCGLGGLNWKVLEELLLEYEENHNIEFHVYSLK